MDSCPKELEPYDIAHRKKIEEQDCLQHAWWGNYGLSAISVAIEHCFGGNKAKSKYIDKPIFSNGEFGNNGYKKGQEEVAVFEMKQRTKLLEKSGLKESPM